MPHQRTIMKFQKSGLIILVFFRTPFSSFAVYIYLLCELSTTNVSRICLYNYNLSFDSNISLLVTQKADKPTYKYAWIMDKLQAERERCISIDTKLRRLETRHFYVNVIDAPGHVEFVHNMITGSSQVGEKQ